MFKILTYIGIGYLAYIWFFKPKPNLGSGESQRIKEEADETITIRVRKKKPETHNDEYIDYQEVE